MVKCDTLLLLEPAQQSPTGREDHFTQKVFVCVGRKEVGKRRGWAF